MAIRKVLYDGDELLRKKSKPVTSFDANLAVLLDDMFETMHKKRRSRLSSCSSWRFKTIVCYESWQRGV